MHLSGSHGPGPLSPWPGIPHCLEGFGGRREGKGSREVHLRVSLVQGFPIIFHGVMGKDEREGNSPSFFNAEEAATVTSYLKLLLTSSFKKGKARLSPRNVGVISPYRKQVRPSVPIKSEPPVPRQYFIHSQTTRWRFQKLRPLWAQRSAAPPSLPPGSLASCLTPSCTRVMAGEKGTCPHLLGGKNPTLHHQTGQGSSGTE